MMLIDNPVALAVIDWLAHGLLGASWWQMVVYALVTTHITICCVTIFLHRHQSHRALDLHAIPSHFFRFWLWIGTGMITKEFVSIHRKHHAKCETEEDPHSPQTRGLKALLLTGTELYRAESRNTETLVKYGHGTPDDWMERNVYTRYPWQGVGLMLVLDLALFGAIGLTIWAVQMAWIPVFATGVINGIGHYWGYRNFESPDASTNVSIWGVLIGGEELHNNHHTYPTSAKFSVKKYEFDIGWVYISILQRMGLAKVRKTPPKLVLGSTVRSVVDDKTLEGLITHRYELMARMAGGIRRVISDEIAVLRAKDIDTSGLRKIRHWLHRDDAKVPASVKPQIEKLRSAHPTLDKMLHMREELKTFWTNTGYSREQLVANLQNWCRRAEASGIDALAKLSRQLCSAKV